MKLEEIKFELGKDYNLKVRRTTVDFKFDKDNFYNVIVTTNKGKTKETPWIIFKDINNAMRAYSDYPKDNEGIVITCDGVVVFEGPKKERKVKTEDTKTFKKTYTRKKK